MILIEFLKNDSVFWVSATVTGIFTLIISIINCVSNRSLKKKQHGYDKMLQNYRSNLNRKNYVSQVRFDTEFKMYQALSAQVANEIINTIILHNESDLPEDRKNEIGEIPKGVQDCVYAYAPFIEKEFFTKFHRFHNDCSKVIQHYLYQKDIDISNVKIKELLDDYLLFMDELRVHLIKLDVLPSINNYDKN